MRLVQFELNNGERRVGLVDGVLVREVQDATSVRDLALAAIEAGKSLAQQVDLQGWAPRTITRRCWPSCAFCRHWITRTRRIC